MCELKAPVLCVLDGKAAYFVSVIFTHLFLLFSISKMCTAHINQCGSSGVITVIINEMTVNNNLFKRKGGERDEDDDGMSKMNWIVCRNHCRTQLRYSFLTLHFNLFQVILLLTKPKNQTVIVCFFQSFFYLWLFDFKYVMFNMCA